MSLAPPRRVTIVAPKVRVDVSLPLQSTVVELVPQLVRMCNADGESQAGLTSWELSRFGAPPLESASTVDSAGVRDGEVLYLHPRDRRPAPLLFDDVVDAIANAAAHQAGTWRSALSRRAGLVSAGLAFAAVAVALGFLGPGGLMTPLLSGLLAVVLLVIGGALARAYGDAAAGAVLAASGLPSVLVAGTHVLGGRVNLLHPTAGQLALGCVALTVYAVLAVVIVVDQAAWFVAVAASATVGALATLVILLAETSAGSTAAVVMVLVIVLSPVLPTMALRLGKLPLPRVPTDVAAFRRDENPTLGLTVAAETRSAERLLTALLSAMGIVVLWCAMVLLRTDHAMAWTLAGLTGLGLLLRARAHVGVGQRLALLLAGSVGVAATGVTVAVNGSPNGRLAVVAVVILVGAVCAAYAIRVLDRSTSPYWSRLLDVLEFVTLISLLPTAAAVLGLYDTVRNWVG